MPEPSSNSVVPWSGRSRPARAACRASSGSRARTLMPVLALSGLDVADLDRFAATRRPNSIMRISLDCARAVPATGCRRPAGSPPPPPRNVRLFIVRLLCCLTHATGQRSAASHDTATRSPVCESPADERHGRHHRRALAAVQRQVIAHHLAEIDRLDDARRPAAIHAGRFEPHALGPHQAGAAAGEADEIGDAQELRDEAVGRPEIGLGRRRDLLGPALVQHHDAVGERQRLFLVVRHQQRRDAEPCAAAASARPAAPRAACGRARPAARRAAGCRA